jgi:hypothetical protein
MDFFNLSPTERILDWRNFRKLLKNKTEMEQLDLTVKYWANVPLSTFSIDWDHPEIWSTPWEMIYEFDLDGNAVAYLMEQTLILSGWDSKRIELSYIKDTKYEEQTMVVIVDNKYLLNYSVGEVFDLDRIKNNCIFLVRYQFINNQHIEV